MPILQITILIYVLWLFLNLNGNEYNLFAFKEIFIKLLFEINDLYFSVHTIFFYISSNVETYKVKNEQ